MGCMWKWFVFLLFIAGLPYVFIYISTSESIELSSRERRDIRDRKPILPKEQLLDESITGKEDIDRNNKKKKAAWIRSQRSPSKTKDENYFQFLARKFGSKVGNKKMTHKEGHDSLNYTIESSLINSDENIHRKEKNYIVFEKESKTMKSIVKRHDTRNDDIRHGNHVQGKRKLQPFSEKTSQRNTPYENRTEACKVSFDKDSLHNARQFLYQSEKPSVYLFYVHLEIENKKEFSSDDRTVDNLLNWQYVLKDQKFLIQLPVDFDLITFNLLHHTQEQKFINLKAFYNNINCTQDSIETIESTRILLWKEFFNNDTRYYLCNRHYLNETGREVLYYITTIWVGYDLTCSEAPTDRGTYAFDVEKDALPLVIPVVAFLLSLQFVWIFALLNENSKNDVNHEEISSFVYKKGDRPFGIKRGVLIKFFYGKCTSSECCTICRPISDNSNTNIDKCKRYFCCDREPRRLVLLLWLFILIPFGTLRTFFRYNLNTGTYEEYPHVLRTSEPLFNAIEDEKKALAFDMIYAILFPGAFIWVGTCYYDAYISEKQCDGSKANSLSERVVSRCCLLCSSCDKDISNKLRISRILCGFIHGILSFFPMFYLFSSRWECLQYENGKKDTKCYTLNYCIILLCFIFIYFLCLRPILSTFTFLLRLCSYFVFVLLPIRLTLFRYTFIVVSAIVYLVKYLHEIINMNSEILDYIFDVKQNKEQQNNTSGSLENIDEETFMYIYKKLMFVKKKLYFFLLKTFIVLAYLIITIETFLSNEDSLTSASFKDIVEIVLVFIGPYAISLFFKGSSKDFLTDGNKKDIDDAYKKYLGENPNVTESTRDQQSDNQNVNTPTNDSSNLGIPMKGQDVVVFV